MDELPMTCPCESFTQGQPFGGLFAGTLDALSRLSIRPEPIRSTGTGDET